MPLTPPADCTNHGVPSSPEQHRPDWTVAPVDKLPLFLDNLDAPGSSVDDSAPQLGTQPGYDMSPAIFDDLDMCGLFEDMVDPFDLL